MFLVIIPAPGAADKALDYFGRIPEDKASVDRTAA